MRKVCLISIVAVCFLLIVPGVLAQRRAARIPQASPPKSFTPLPIRKVIIYSNGMAYIERRGTVSGNAEINLSFKQSQVDDVLKSMVVLDLGRGRIGAISYNSSAPLGARISENPFDINSESNDNEDESGGLAAVLSQLQGAKVIVNSGKQTATGSILTVEKKAQIIKAKDDGENKLPGKYTLVIASEDGNIYSFDLADIRSVKLLDEDARKDLTQFANATASARRRDAKTINITSSGAGQREMIVSYTVAAPIWKTTYRVVLDDEGKPFFQGWAIVDNVSEEDWQNVQMSLVSGSPISFIQPIQKPLYRHRPVIEIKDDLSLEPQIYEPALIAPSSSTDRVQGSGVGYGSGSGSGRGYEKSNAVVDVTSDDQPMRIDTSVNEALISNNSGIQTAAKGEEFGDLFEYKIENPVTVLKDRSALIPIVQTRMEGERVSIYNESARQDRPMSGMLLNNTTQLTFEDGSMTVLDKDAYAGEALMERLKPKEKRLISFAVDLGTLVTVRNESVREPAKLVKAVNGTLQVHYFNSTKKIYKFSNQTDREKVVFIEYPMRDQWVLSESTPKPFDITQNNYRFRVELKPFETLEFPVSEQQGLMDSYQLSALTYDDLDLFIKRRYIDEATKQRLAKLVDLKIESLSIQNKLAALEDEEEAISKDQSRLRENMESLPKTPEAKQLITRYISKANEQETRIEAISKERAKLKEDFVRLQTELAIEIKNFNL